ncbi:hypothetical protein FHS18_006001 [Paenibacillus phyllosphaerae]|uniref:Uncharacterized protein n=1 Tax=Paenibacillus phyllosphaerae TaxID=274593 RepID=A0A7W5B582_9BACL|nr:hypothetical protein [Paenibacillus phyllosphaerae]MBB3113886.1 hypothetical protein [Paenibacillus phyllosphaerae]
MSDRVNLTQYAAIIEQITAGIYEAYPELMERFGEAGKRKCMEDNEHHFRYLETAYALRRQQTFTDYAAWLNNILEKRGMKADHLIDNFERIDRAISGQLEPRKEQAFHTYLRAAIDRLLAHEV